jgi:hypothetical protein
VSEIVTWARVEIVAPDGTARTVSMLAGFGAPDLTVVDAVARAQLLARRVGARLRLYDVCAELSELLAFVGLRVEMRGEPEEGEQRVVVQREERVERGDLAV